MVCEPSALRHAVALGEMDAINGESSNGHPGPAEVGHKQMANPLGTVARQQGSGWLRRQSQERGPIPHPWTSKPFAPLPRASSSPPREAMGRGTNPNRSRSTAQDPTWHREHGLSHPHRGKDPSLRYVSQQTPLGIFPPPPGLSSFSSVLHKRKVSPRPSLVIARTHREMGKCQALNIYYSDDAFYSIQWVWMFYKQRLNCHKELLAPLF